MKSKPKATWTDTTVTVLTSITKKLSNWKAPGLDQVQNFWIKHLASLHPIPNERFNQAIKNPETAPTWLTGGRTTLIYKKGETDEAKTIDPSHAYPHITN